MEKQEEPQCRICFQEQKSELIPPCRCRGSVAYVHRRCLDRWIRFQLGRHLVASPMCEICGFEYLTQLRFPSFATVLSKAVRYALKDKGRSLKTLLYFFYIAVFARKGVQIMSMLGDVFKRRYKYRALSVLATLYVVFVLSQLFYLGQAESRRLYKFCMYLKFSCAEIIIKSLRQDELQAH